MLALFMLPPYRDLSSQPSLGKDVVNIGPQACIKHGNVQCLSVKHKDVYRVCASWLGDNRRQSDSFRRMHSDRRLGLQCQEGAISPG